MTASRREGKGSISRQGVAVPTNTSSRLPKSEVTARLCRAVSESGTAEVVPSGVELVGVKIIVAKQGAGG
jgi:hypothetical protein